MCLSAPIIPQISPVGMNSYASYCLILFCDMLNRQLGLSCEHTSYRYP